MNQSKYPVGIQSFEKLRSDGFLYIDKTELIYSLINTGGFIFLSRPRRFGKSLLLSTISTYFEGKRELFRGLAIDRLTDDWDPHPVLYLDLNSREYTEPDKLVKHLNQHLETWEALYGDKYKDRDIEERFGRIIQAACEKTGKKVVILIDEYDKPLLQSIHNEEMSETYRSQLKALYSNLKTQDKYIHFAILTGVARFSRLSVFSDLNNLRDISFENKKRDMTDITSL